MTQAARAARPDPTPAVEPPAPASVRRRSASTLNVPFELYIAIRYLLARRRQAFISLISLISTIGVAVGVCALIIALALMTGLQGELRDRIVGSAAHVYVWKIGQGGIQDYRAEAARLRGLEHVAGAAPAILGKALISSASAEAFINFKGIDPALEGTVTELGRAMRSGGLEELEGRDEGLDGIVIGTDLATQLGAFTGDTVTLLTPTGTLTPMGMLPRQRRFVIVGTFNLGLYEFDSTYGFVTLEVARRFLGKEGVDFLQLRVDDIYRAPEIAETIGSRLGSEYLTQDWADMNRSLFSALWIEKMAISITIGLIVMVAALNIIASLILLVMEKSRDIAILKTMGAGARSVMGIFMLQGLIIGLVGTLVGAAAGYGLCAVLDRYQLIRIPVDVYQISHVPFTIDASDFGLVIVAAIVICFLATIYPSRQASRLDPAQALRYQ
jgi:lipoprotein-releasing system permease protein